MSLYEYENDLSVRRMIHRLLINGELARYAEFSDFERQIADIDNRFRALLQDEVTIGESDDPWWERGVPRIAGAELASDFEQTFGVWIPEIAAK